MMTELSASTRNSRQQARRISTTPNKPKSTYSSYRSPPPFSISSTLKTPLKSGNSNGKGFDIMRTRSLDDQQQQEEEQQQKQYNPRLPQEDIEMLGKSSYCEGGGGESSSSCCNDGKDEGTTVATALHSSFDMSLLRDGGGASCSSGEITLFGNGFDDEEEDDRIIDARNASLDPGDLSSSGEKCNNQHHQHNLRSKRAVSGEAMSYIDLKPPATLRKNQSTRSKARRRSGDSATTATTTATFMSLSPAPTPFSLSLSLSNNKTPAAHIPGRPLRHVINNKNSNTNTNNNARTPAKSVPQHRSPAPSSTAKRRRAPLAYPARQSPMRRVATSSTSSVIVDVDVDVANTPNTTFPPAPPFSIQQVSSTATSGSNGVGDKNNNYPALTPTHQNLSSSGPYGTVVKKMPYYTGTTTGTTPLKTTFETDGDNSVDTNNSPARFRFTSFPASLPRVHNHASNNQYSRTTPPVCPGSVRKRMSFDTEDDAAVAETEISSNKDGDDNDDDDDDDPVGLNYSSHQHHDANQSRDADDGTHNTSLSSLSVEGGHHQHLPHLPHQHPPHFASAPMKNLLLFPGEQEEHHHNNNNDHHRHEELNNNLFGYSDDKEDDLPPVGNYGGGGISTIASPDQEGAVRRTRLNFNVFLSPSNGNKSSNHNSKENEYGVRRIDLPNVDLSRPYDQNRINSFPSSLSSQTHINASTHTCEENLIVGGTSSSMSPPRTAGRKGNNNNPPETPREVQLHFSLESECSPILGVPKQNFDDATRTRTTAMLDRSRHENNNLSAASSVTTLVGDRLIPPKTAISSPSHSAHSATRHGSQKEEGSSISSSSESTTTTQKRRIRPMPDMSAFEIAKTGTRAADRSVDDSTTAGDSRGMTSMGRRERACPPTPQRTPAWANEGGNHAFWPARQNSLIMTKVLLSCPTQVLEGRSSLETSVLDEDSKGGVSRRNSLSNGCDPGSGAEGSKNPASSHETQEDENVLMDVEKCDPIELSSVSSPSAIDRRCKTSRVQIAAPPKLMRRLPSNPDNNAVISFSHDFEILGNLGSGAFADVYKVRLKSDDHLYAVKRNRRQFRGKRDREMALAEVQSMQRLQSVFAHNTGEKNSSHHSNNTSSENNKNCYSLYLLFFYRAWQEDGYFYSQTELCCRDTCREMLDSLRFLWNSAKKKYPSLVKKLPPPTSVQAGSQLDTFGRLVPNMTVWKICHDISAGLSHIHSHGIVHQDIKPSNIFLITNARFGAMCKIGDFGLAGRTGSSGDGQEGDTRYMPPELLASATRHTSSDIFSLGLTLYEIAMDEHIEMPSEGPCWHQLRSSNEPKLPTCRGDNLQRLLQSMTDPDEQKRPTADSILDNENVKVAGHEVDTFLQDYIKDVEEFDRREEERLAVDQTDDQTPRNGHRSTAVRSPSLSMLLPEAPTLFSPPAKFIHS